MLRTFLRSYVNLFNANSPEAINDSLCLPWLRRGATEPIRYGRIQRREDGGGGLSLRRPSSVADQADKIRHAVDVLMDGV